MLRWRRTADQDLVLVRRWTQLPCVHPVALLERNFVLKSHLHSLKLLRSATLNRKSRSRSASLDRLDREQVLSCSLQLLNSPLRLIVFGNLLPEIGSTSHFPGDRGPKRYNEMPDVVARGLKALKTLEFLTTLRPRVQVSQELLVVRPLRLQQRVSSNLCFLALQLLLIASVYGFHFRHSDFIRGHVDKAAHTEVVVSQY